MEIEELKKRLRSIGDKLTKQLTVKNWLMHNDAINGEKLKKERFVEICNDRHCSTKQSKCKSHLLFLDFNFCTKEGD